MRMEELRTGTRRVEASNCAYTPLNHKWLTVNTEHLRGRGDIALYNVNVSGSDVPLIILLHGAHASHWSWMYSGGVHQTYGALKDSHAVSDFVLVMPSDGLSGDATGYLPLTDGNYERWIVCDVVETVMQVVPCVGRNSRIYLGGISMGGYAALRLGAKFPGMFAAISCHSPVVALSALDAFGYVDRPDKPKGLIDAEDADIVNWIARSAHQLPPIQIDCGKSDPLIDSIREFHRALVELRVAHDYAEFPGGHDWSYWARHVGDSLLLFDRIEKRLAAMAAAHSE